MPEDREEGEQFRKLFVGGLHFETSDEALKEYFEKYGEIVDCVVMRDPNTRRSRGFGFITFRTADMLDDAQKARPHRIDGKEVETKRAMPREDAGRPDIHLMSKKVYVSGVRDGIEEQDLREYFGRYGDVENVEIIIDKSTGQRRGFAFVSFHDYDPVDKIVLSKSHTIRERRCDVKKAMSKEEMAQLRFGAYPFDSRGGSRGGLPRGRGGYNGRDMSFTMRGAAPMYDSIGGGDFGPRYPPYEGYRGGYSYYPQRSRDFEYVGGPAYEQGGVKGGYGAPREAWRDNGSAGNRQRGGNDRGYSSSRPVSEGYGGYGQGYGSAGGYRAQGGYSGYTRTPRGGAGYRR